MKAFPRVGALVTALALIASLPLAVGLLAPASAETPSPAPPTWTPPPEPPFAGAPKPTSCDAGVPQGQVACFAVDGGKASDTTATATGANDATATPQTVANPTPSDTYQQHGAFAPSDLYSAYGIPTTLTRGTLMPTSQPTSTVAIVDAYSDPDIEANLDYYRTYFGLPACTTANGCFTQVDQSGGSALPAEDSGWDFETTMDVEAVSAMCPSCHILLVDAASANMGDMGQAATTAASRASYVSMSFGSLESSSETRLDPRYYGRPGVTYVASSGDYGFSHDNVNGDGVVCSDGCPVWPSTSPDVVAAGGTSVRLTNGAWQHTVWDGAGSDCSSYETGPAAQRGNATVASACGSRRATTDVSALADPNTGMLVYDSGSFYYGGGTSLSSPLITAMYALAGNHTSPLDVYANDASNPGAFTDVTSGETLGCDGTVLCAAGPGWDGPTGLGSPDSLAALAVHSSSAPTSVSTSTPTPTPTPPAPAPPAPVPTATPTPTPTLTPTPTTLTPTPTPTSPTGSPTATPTSAPRQHLAPTRRPTIGGTFRPGRRVEAAFGTIRPTSGPARRVRVAITWYLNGHLVRGAHGRALRVRSAWRGKHLSYRVHATAQHCTPLTLGSPRSRRIR